MSYSLNYSINSKRQLVRLITREGLVSFKRKALRRRVWFRALSKIERGIVDLTIRCVDRVRSWKLALIIGRIRCKIFKALRSRFLEKAETAGYDLAERVSMIAVSWGYTEASSWKRDIGFVRYLGVNALNNGAGWSLR